MYTHFGFSRMRLLKFKNNLDSTIIIIEISTELSTLRSNYPDENFTMQTEDKCQTVFLLCNHMTFNVSSKISNWIAPDEGFYLQFGEKKFQLVRRQRNGTLFVVGTVGLRV
jgi:hypothetical protein